MKRASLTLRLSLMFVCAVVAVLVVAGVSVNELTRHHFKELDRQTLMEKLEATTQILDGKSGSLDGADVELQLRALLGAHPELSAIIMGKDGVVLFSAPNAIRPPGIEPDPEHNISEWSEAGRMYRGMTATVRTVHQAQAVTVWLILDVTSHMHFFETLQWWFVLGLVVSTIVSAALGWLVARNGLRPVEQVTRAAAAMSARSLKERIPLSQCPKSCCSWSPRSMPCWPGWTSPSSGSLISLPTLRTNCEPQSAICGPIRKSSLPKSGRQRPMRKTCIQILRTSTGSQHHRRHAFLAKSDNGLLLPAQEKVDLRDVVEKLLNTTSCLPMKSRYSSRYQEAA